MSDLLGEFVGTTIGTVVVGVPALLGKRSWQRQAHRLARRNDIALPESIERRVARWLKARFALSILVINPVAVVLVDNAMTSGSDTSPFRLSPGHYTAALVLLPLVLTVLALIGALPRWNKDRNRRVAHFAQTTFDQIFTDTERRVLGLGALATAVASLWGLHYVGSGAWWYLWIVPVGVTVLVGRWSAGVILSRPSAATDTLELGWDDLLRFQRAREQAIGAAWAPAVLIGLLDYCAVPWSSFDLLVPFAGLAALMFVVSLPFKQGRDLWRNAWGIPRPGTAG